MDGCRRWLDGPGPKALDGAFGALFSIVLFSPGKERKKHRKFWGGGESMPSEGARDVAVVLLFYCFRFLYQV